MSLVKVRFKILMMGVNETCCLLCDASCDSDKTLDFHIKTIHKRLFVCTMCPNFTTMLQPRLTHHLLSVHKNETTSEKVDSQTPSTTKMDSGSDSPDVEVLESFDEKSVSSLKTKNDVDDMDELKVFECDSCWFTTHQRPELGEHLMSQHGFSKEAARLYISKPFSDSNKLSGHVPTVKTPIRSSSDSSNSSCTSTSSGTSKNLFKQMRCVMKCGLCDYKTNDVFSINSHVGRGFHFAPGKESICPHCPFTPANSSELVEHGKSHFANFALITYMCSRCSYKADNVETQEKHFEDFHGE